MEKYMYPKMARGSYITKFRRSYMVARRFDLLKAMCTCGQPWADIIGYFVEKVGTYHGKTRITTLCVLLIVLIH